MRVAVVENDSEESVSGCEDEVSEAADGCNDGVDGDCDGLIDCEDGDCAEACAETDCGDSLDDDEDGRIDCLDDDCWATLDCATPTGVPLGTEVSSRVLGGEGMLHSYFLIEDDSGYRTVRRGSGTAWSVWGTAAVRAPSATTSTICTWSADTVSWLDYSARLPEYDVSFQLIEREELGRAGVSLDEDCPLRGGFFLPLSLGMNDGPRAKTQSGALWYHGAVTDFHYAYGHSSYDARGASRKSYQWTWSMNDFASGETYTVVTQ